MLYLFQYGESEANTDHGEDEIGISQHEDRAGTDQGEDEADISQR